MVKFKEQEYKDNGYMNGLCSTCHSWEAPITVKELANLKDRKAHKGSSVKVIDSAVLYRRKEWHEFFVCPVCAAKFAVKYSDM